MKKFFLFFIVAAVLSLILWLFLPASTDRTEQVGQQQKILRAQPTDPFRGLRDAPVTIVMAASFTCPACREGMKTMAQLLDLYPEKLKIVWKDLPESGGASFTAAVAGRCAQQQGKFWPYAEVLFSHQDLLLENDDLYVDWAKDAGLKTDIFKACLRGEETARLVNGTINEALAAGVSAVPIFQIGEQRLEGVQHLQTFRSIIDNLIFNRP